MARTVAEQREYQRGYNRALQRCRDRVDAVLNVARAYRAKAEQAIYHDTVPRCVGCRRWTRGGENCLWGYCEGAFEYGAGESQMWVDRFVGEKEDRKIVTKEMFGCVNWISR